MQQLGLSAQLRVPILHHHPRHAMLQLEAAIAELGAPLLVGSSLGGYYATHLAERHGLKALLVNPAVTPHKRFDGYLGSQRNHYTGETWELTLDHMQALAELEVPPPEDPNRYQVWLQTADETLTIATPNAITAPVPCVSSRRRPQLPGFAAQIPALLAFAGIARQQYAALDFSVF